MPPARNNLPLLPRASQLRKEQLLAIARELGIADGINPQTVVNIRNAIHTHLENNQDLLEQQRYVRLFPNIGIQNQRRGQGQQNHGQKNQGQGQEDQNQDQQEQDNEGQGQDNENQGQENEEQDQDRGQQEGDQQHGQEGPPFLPDPFEGASIRVEPVSPHNTAPKGRPAIVPGLEADTVPFHIPEEIRKKFKSGWNTHIPLMFLMDRHCMLGRTPMALTDGMSLDKSTGLIVHVEKMLPAEEEYKIDFDEWQQAWRRLLDLIETYIPDILPPWKHHYERILNALTHASQWDTWRRYDIELRRQSTHKGIDPQVFSHALIEMTHPSGMARGGASFAKADQATTTEIHARHPNSLMENHAFSSRAKVGSAGTAMETLIVSDGTESQDVTQAPDVDMESTHAPSAEENMLPNHAPLSDPFCPIVTPLNADAWEWELCALELYHLFPDIPSSLRDGFNMGVHSNLQATYTPPNHASATDNPSVIKAHINEELTAGRYTGPFSKSRLENIIGPFCSSLLGTIPKSDNPGNFPCDWGTFNQVYDIVRDAPPGLQAATMDVEAAFRCCPIRPSQQNHFIIYWNGSFYIDHNAPFGECSSGGVFGRLADAMTAIIRKSSRTECKKWVDDFLIFRIPVLSSSNPSHPQVYDFDIIDLMNLGCWLQWPWKPSKTCPFSHTFCYLGFDWDIINKTVSVPSEKAQCYITKIKQWTTQNNSLRKEAERIHGTLVHCSLALPDGRTHLAALSRFAASFQGKPPFSCQQPNKTVLEDMNWWLAELLKPSPGSPIIPPPPLSPIEFWVDASTSFGIGIVFKGGWDAWKLLPGWDKNPEHRIGWAEMVAIELGLRLAIHHGHHNIHFQIKSDNTGVIGAIAGGRSRNLTHNQILQRITTLLRTHSIWISSLYVSSESNLADKPSRGIPPPGFTHFRNTFKMPDMLNPYLEHCSELLT
ncbi:hypothetical protein NP233_g11129 [Leucocoprinus birnbaumii]|uniref:Uncharacterized protein n=1 Tax=Leucocoprinus birnbaumii TaxID=56174 RepID=A0AAD5VHZ4_9AGAR|nr:hypothetical protein NP233_g11129 [Leucocoprinus birnbaumii]